MLNEFINKKNIEMIQKNREEFVINEPFPHISIDKFLKDEIAQKIKTEVLKENYYLEDHDLYQFERTFDLRNSKNKFIQEIRGVLLSKEFLKYIEKLTNSKIDHKNIDFHSLKLKNTHYLLCHDDDVKNREIAFIINLSNNWEKEWGGKLELFESKNNLPTIVSKSITPKFNQFNIFKVTPGKSFHQISEVLKENVERISISGWYYKK
jgi:Rps23 Pro-64 3,4-dihydroxylase Tpa1-like proline 4-hydroxylase